jgi:hypothetical protein
MPAGFTSGGNMDLICTRCGEPWHVDHVLHDDPEAFERRGGRIDHCPSCPKDKPNHSPKQQERLDAIRELGDMLGDDIDGLAGLLEDFNLL